MSLTAWLVDALVKVVKEASWLGVFATMVLESACLPIPSEAVMPLAGFALCSSLWDVAFASVLASVANLTGSWIAYFLGAKGGRAFVKRYGKYLLIGDEEFSAAERLFSRYGGVAVLIGRMMPAIRTFISLPAGLFSMNPVKFTAYTLIGSIPWNFALAYIGYILSENWKLILKYAHLLDALALTAALGAVVYLYSRVRRTA